MAQIYVNQFLTRKDKEYIKDSRRLYATSRDYYSKLRRDRSLLPVDDIEGISDKVYQYRYLLYSDLWDSASVLHEPRDCSYFPSYAILKRVVYQYIQMLQLYSILADSLLDTYIYYNDHLGSREYDCLSELYTYGTLLEGIFSNIEYGVNTYKYTHSYDTAIISNETEITISLESIGPHNYTNMCGYTQYPFNPSSLDGPRINLGAKIGAVDDRYMDTMDEFKKYASYGRQLIIDSIRATVTVVYGAPTVTSYEGKLGKRPILGMVSEDTEDKEYIHYLTNARKKFNFKLHTPLKVTNPFYGGFIRSWLMRE